MTASNTAAIGMQSNIEGPREGQYLSRGKALDAA
jgi:hypothetical protein